MLPSNFLYEFHWNEFDIHRDALIEHCLKHEKPNTIESNIAIDAKTNLWESTFQFLKNDNPAVVALKLWMVATVEEFIRRSNQKNYKFAITECWAHVTRQHGWHAAHTHPGSTWSGIFYVDEGDVNCGGTTCFISPFNVESKPGLDFYQNECRVAPVPGMLIVFPSSLIHYVQPYIGTAPRITIAFNSICI
jgi:uncharacterized protein (TIGR02466 family)